MIRVFAPAKINLALHVTGQRSDGYHLLDMLVGFADVGDWLTLGYADVPRLTVLGGAQISAPNIISRVVDAFSVVPLDITLEKNLPIASGMGGGSADAAATYRGIWRCWAACRSQMIWQNCWKLALMCRCAWPAPLPK